MATLADSFLHDLEDLNDISDQKVEEIEEEEEDFIIDAIKAYDDAQLDSVAIVSDLMKKTHFIELLARVKEAMEDTEVGEEAFSPELLKDNALHMHGNEYPLIDQCNEMVVQIDTEILSIHKFIRDIYSKQFPELESIVYSPLEYIAIVERLKNETDLAQLDLSDLLPNTVIMAVTVAASMTTGTPLPPSELEKVLGAAREAMQLADCRKEILLYLESRMNLLAPNLTAIIGSALAARLVSHAGGLLNLARMPAQNIMLIGNSKKAALGMSAASTSKNSIGLIYSSEIIQNTPPMYRHRSVKMVCTKCALAARVDSFHEAKKGEIGVAYRDHIIKMLLKLQEPPVAPQKRSLPVPDEKQKTRRGGKRYRQMKEKFGITDLRKQANRLKFGLDPEEETSLEFGKGLGMIGQSTGKGKVRVQVKNKKVQMPKRRQQLIPRASSGGTGGMSSSLAFTPVQGIELQNPDAVNMKSQTGAEKYFSGTAKFRKSGAPSSSIPSA